MTDILDRARAAGCPVSDFEVAPTRTAGSYHQQGVVFRDGGPIWMSQLAQGFWMITDHAMVREMQQTPEIFSAESVTPQQPDQGFLFIPGNQDPPEHKAYRAFLNPWFAPKAVREAEPNIRRIARRWAEEIAPKGEADLASGYCLAVATEAFLNMTGLPTEDTEKMMVWVDDFFRGFANEEAHERGDGKQPRFDAAVRDVGTYMMGMCEDRRTHPRDPATDMFTALVQYRIDGRLLTDEELQGYTFLLFNGGLDTTRAQMSWLFHRLALSPEDRRRVIESPGLVALAAEESLRFNPCVMGTGRKVAKDVNWHGVDLKRGDMAWGMLTPANRDHKVYDDPDTFVLDRRAPNLGFGSGIHRCVASHFARAEMRIGIEEFHRLIPDYELAPGVDIKERGVVLALNTLPVRWTP